MSDDGPTWSYALAPDLKIARVEGGTLLTSAVGKTLVPGFAEAEALAVLAGEGATDEGIAALMRRGGQGTPAVAAGALLFRLDRQGFLARRLHAGGQRLVSCVPRRAPPAGLPAALPQGLLRLAPTALVRAEAGQLVLEVPDGWASVLLHSRALAPLLHDLATAAAADSIASGLAGCSADAVMAVLGLLNRCCLLDRGEADHWSSHDMLFHARTRRGYARMLLGKTNPGKPDESPVSADPGPCIALRLPDLGRLCAEDLSFAEIAARRRSIRQYGANSLTLDQVSEFLFRTLHARDGRRPYPSGGGIYPLQAYLAVGRCIGLAPGGYAYDPLRHALVAVADAGTGLDGLLDEAMGTAGVNERPQVLLLLAARYALTARVYGDLAYGLILKEVGAVFQTAMLAATAMGIGSCPLGSGNSLAFAEWMNFDPRVETAVGELMLGSL